MAGQLQDTNEDRLRHTAGATVLFLIAGIIITLAAIIVALGVP